MSKDNESRHNCSVHWIEQDGALLPKRLGGHPALDFCNTWAGWAEEVPPTGGEPDPKREWLPDYATFAAWAHYAELIDGEQLARLREAAAGHPRKAASVVRQARELRSVVRAAVLDPDDAEALAALNGYAKRAAAASEIVPGPGAARWVVSEKAGLELPLLAVARSAADLLTSSDVLTACACPGVECGWLFLDKRGRRRWCDMAVCGNRAKVAAHARRAKEKAAT